jgi:hypothetical protein
VSVCCGSRSHARIHQVPQMDLCWTRILGFRRDAAMPNCGERGIMREKGIEGRHAEVDSLGLGNQPGTTPFVNASPFTGTNQTNELITSVASNTTHLNCSWISSLPKSAFVFRTTLQLHRPGWVDRQSAPCNYGLMSAATSLRLKIGGDTEFLPYSRFL